MKILKRFRNYTRKKKIEQKSIKEKKKRYKTKKYFYTNHTRKY